MTDSRRYEIDTAISVLGTVYTVKTAIEAEDKDLKGCDGYCDFQTKRIVLEQETETFDRMAYLKKCVRHEIIHAFLYEGGLGPDWEHKPFGQEETVVDWIAIQHDKLHNAFLTAYEGIKEVSGDAD